MYITTCKFEETVANKHAQIGPSKVIHSVFGWERGFRDGSGGSRGIIRRASKLTEVARMCAD